MNSTVLKQIELKRSHLQTLLTIRKGFDYYKTYYQNLSLAYPVIVFKEFEVLNEDFEEFIMQSIEQNSKFEHYIFESLYRSFLSLRYRYLSVFPYAQGVFLIWLEESINQMALIRSLYFESLEKIS